MCGFWRWRIGSDFAWIVQETKSPQMTRPFPRLPGREFAPYPAALCVVSGQDVFPLARVKCRVWRRFASVYLLLKVTDGAADNAYVGRLGEHKANPGKRLCCLTRRQVVSF
jgi:hypothetical protein